MPMYALIGKIKRLLRSVDSTEVVVTANISNVQLKYLSKTEPHTRGQLSDPAGGTDNVKRLLQICSNQGPLLL